MDAVNAEPTERLTFATKALAYQIGYFMCLPQSKADYNETGRAYVWCSQQALAERTHCNVSRASTYIQQLIDCGYMRTVNRGNQIKGSNKYRILFKNVKPDETP